MQRGFGGCCGHGLRLALTFPLSAIYRCAESAVFLEPEVCVPFPGGVVCGAVAIAAAEAVDMRHMGIDVLDHCGARLLDFDCELRIGEPADIQRGGIVPAHGPVKRVSPPAQSLVGEFRFHDVVV